MSKNLDVFVLAVEVIFAVLVISIIVLIPISSKSREIRFNDYPLSFRREIRDEGENLVFRIMQVADIHLGENAWEAWGPRADQMTFDALRSYLNHSEQLPIDLVVLSGDQLTANNVDANASKYYSRLGLFLNEQQIPFATIFGNHDDAPLEKRDEHGKIRKFPAKTDRTQLFEALQDFPFSVAKQGPRNLHGVSNFWLNVEDENKNTKLRLAFVDTGGGTLSSSLTKTHAEWFETTSREKPDVAVAVFQHIPTKEFAASDERCRGLHQDGVSPVDEDDAHWIHLLQQNSNVKLVAVGHNHGNDYCCRLQEGPSLCFGRHSGYGGYGSWERGVRIYEFQLQSTRVNWTSWVLLESGEVIDKFSPFQ